MLILSILIYPKTGKIDLAQSDLTPLDIKALQRCSKEPGVCSRHLLL